MVDSRHARRYRISTEDTKILYLLERQTQGDKRGGVLAFSADSSRLATGDSTGAVRIWDLSSREIIRAYRAHAGRVVDLSFHPSGDYLASSGGDGTVRVWDSQNEQRWKEWPVRYAYATAINLQSKLYATFIYQKLLFLPQSAIQLRDTKTGALIKELGKFNLTYGSVKNALTFSPDGTRLAGEIGDNVLKVWDTETGESVAVLKGHTNRVVDMALDPQAKRLASCTSQEVRLWDLQSGRQIALVPTTGEGRQGIYVNSIAFSPDGKHLAVAGTGASTREHLQPGRVEIWDIATTQPLQTWSLAHEKPVADVAFSHDGRLLATAGWDEIVGLWDLETGEQIHKLSGHRSYVRGVTFSPDDERLVSTGSTTKLWDTQTGQEILTLDVGGTQASFDPLAQSLGVCGTRRVIFAKAPQPQIGQSASAESVGK